MQRGKRRRTGVVEGSGAKLVEGTEEVGSKAVGEEPSWRRGK